MPQTRGWNGTRWGIFRAGRREGEGSEPPPLVLVHPNMGEITRKPKKMVKNMRRDALGDFFDSLNTLKSESFFWEHIQNTPPPIKVHLGP